MSKLLDLSEKLDSTSITLFETLSEVTGSLGIPFFVMGATARDMIFELGYGRPSRRATYDRDLGVCVASWAEFENLKKQIFTSGHFKPTHDIHRIRYRGDLDVDILPFGGIAGTGEEICWPPDKAIVMSVAGFAEAFRAALTVRVKAIPPLDVLVASPPGLAILKLISWSDRPHERSRDALDLAYILENYLDAGNNERLYEEHMDLVEVERFDYLGAGARLLGRDLARIGQPKTMRRIEEILKREISDGGQHLLIQGMTPTGTLFEGEREGRSDELLALLQQFKKGVEDR